jgi:hypothetical protein
MERWYRDGIDMRGCHPRDLVEGLVDAARFRKTPVKLTVDLLNDVCSSYFLS